MDDFATCTSGADITIVSDVYAASESLIEGVNSEILAGKISLGGRVCHYCKGQDEIFSLLPEIVRDGDIIVFMGAGTVTHWAREFVSL
jgi:UDP-N-acetylmuramate--alanine ligase